MNPNEFLYNKRKNKKFYWLYGLFSGWTQEKKTTNHLNMMFFFRLVCLPVLFLKGQIEWKKNEIDLLSKTKNKNLLIYHHHHHCHTSHILFIIHIHIDILMMMISAVMKKNFVAWRQSMFKSSSSSSIYIDIDIIRKKHPPNFVHVSNTHIAHIDINFQPL